jgi:putative serine/threonine protein kinase
LNEAFSVELNSLNQDPYVKVVCYPRFIQSDFDQKISELSRLGIESLCFRGDKSISGVPILGKGCVGVVVSGCKTGEPVAVKILRTDANRKNFSHESLMLRKANSVGVGPSYIDNSEKIMISRYLEGLMLPQWIAQRHRGEISLVKKTLKQILLQCFRLDQIGLDHGELSRASKHIIVDKIGVAAILDFETASTNRRVSNVTSICGFLFFSMNMSQRVRRLINAEPLEGIRDTLASYKKKPTLRSFKSVMSVCGLGTEDPGSFLLP